MNRKTFLTLFEGHLREAKRKRKQRAEDLWYWINPPQTSFPLTISCPFSSCCNVKWDDPRAALEATAYLAEFRSSMPLKRQMNKVIKKVWPSLKDSELYMISILSLDPNLVV